MVYLVIILNLPLSPQQSPVNLSIYRTFLFLLLSSPPFFLAILTEYAKSIVRDENVSPCHHSRQLIPYS